MEQFCVYVHTDKDGHPRYVGKGSRGRAKSRHNRSKAWRDIFAHEPFDVHIMSVSENEEAALRDEIFVIKQLREDGYDIVNVSAGGDGLYKTDLSDEFHDAVSMLRGGKNSFWFGKKRQPITEWHKQRIRDLITGRKHTPETIAKFKAAAAARPEGNRNNLLGMKIPDATKEKMSAASKFRTLSEESKKKSLETRQALYASGYNNKRCKPVICIDKGAEYPSAVRAAEALGLCDKKISSVCTGKRKSHGKLRFKFKTEVQ